MATTTYKILGQLAPTNGNETALYTVPASTSTVVSTISVANITGADATYSVAITPTNAAATNDHWLVKGATVPKNSTVTYTLGLTMAAANAIRVQSGTANAVTFQAFGSEMIP